MTYLHDILEMKDTFQLCLSLLQPSDQPPLDDGTGIKSRFDRLPTQHGDITLEWLPQKSIFSVLFLLSFFFFFFLSKQMRHSHLYSGGFKGSNMMEKLKTKI